MTVYQFQADELGRLLDVCDDTANGDSNDAEREAFLDALDYALGLLTELGVEIERKDSRL